MTLSDLTDPSAIREAMAEYDEIGREAFLEVKGGSRPVEDSARAATLDLLACRQAFTDVFDGSESVYGLGVAWAAELHPSLGSEIILASPENLDAALEICGF